MNFAAIALHRAEAWLAFAAARVPFLKMVDGGASCATKHLVKLFIGGPLTFHNGFAISLKGVATLVRGKVTNILGNEAALKAAWLSKGASGIKLCLCCINVIKRAADERIDDVSDDDPFVDVSCTRWDKVIPATDSEVWAQVDEVNVAHADAVEGKHPMAAYEALATASGFVASPQGVLSDVALRSHLSPIEATTFDWFHTWLQAGIASVEIFNFLKTAKRIHKIRYADFQILAQANWSWPGVHDNTKVTKVFSLGRESASKGGVEGERFGDLDCASLDQASGSGRIVASRQDGRRDHIVVGLLPSPRLLCLGEAADLVVHSMRDGSLHPAFRSLCCGIWTGRFQTEAPLRSALHLEDVRLADRAGRFRRRAEAPRSKSIR